LITDVLREIEPIEPTYKKAFLLLNAGQVAKRISRTDNDKATHWALLAHGAFNESIAISKQINNPHTLSMAQGYLGQLYEDIGDTEDALNLTRKAAFNAQQIDAPELLYLWEWQRGRLLDKRGNKNGAIDSFRRAVIALQRIRQDLTANLSSGASTFRSTVGPIYFTLADLLLQKTATISDPRMVQKELREAQATIEQLKAAELQDYFSDSCISRQQEKSKGIQVDNRTATIYPILLPERTELLISFSDQMQQVTVPVTRHNIATETLEFRRRLEKRTTRQFLRHAKKLHDWLIKPIESVLKNRGITTLVFVPDGALRTIPMSALHDGKSFLIDRYAIATVPGLNLTTPQPLQKENLQLLMSALTEPVQGFSALPNVSNEVNSVQKIFQSNLLQDKN